MLKLIDARLAKARQLIAAPSLLRLCTCLYVCHCGIHGASPRPIVIPVFQPGCTDEKGGRIRQLIGLKPPILDTRRTFRTGQFCSRGSAPQNHSGTKSSDNFNRAESCLSWKPPISTAAIPPSVAARRIFCATWPASSGTYNPARGPYLVAVRPRLPETTMTPCASKSRSQSTNERSV